VQAFLTIGAWGGTLGVTNFFCGSHYRTIGPEGAYRAFHGGTGLTRDQVFHFVHSGGAPD